MTIVRTNGGGGQMGVLYLAADPRIERQVALKVLRVSSSEFKARFLHEARAAGRLSHPNIVTIFDVGDHEGQPYIAMEYVPGDTLRSLIAARAVLPYQRRLSMIVQLCDGLAFAHRAGIVHPDIKPANLMLGGESGTLKILDFGIARSGARCAPGQVGMERARLEAALERLSEPAEPGLAEYQGPARLRVSRELDIVRFLSNARGRLDEQDHPGAMGVLDAALALDPGHRVALELQSEVERAREGAERRRRGEAMDRMSQDGIGAADQEYERGDIHQAIARLESLGSSRSEVMDRLTRWRAQL